MPKIREGSDAPPRYDGSLQSSGEGEGVGYYEIQAAIGTARNKNVKPQVRIERLIVLIAGIDPTTAAAYADQISAKRGCFGKRCAVEETVDELVETLMSIVGPTYHNVHSFASRFESVVGSVVFSPCPAAGTFSDKTAMYVAHGVKAVHAWRVGQPWKPVCKCKLDATESHD